MEERIFNFSAGPATLPLPAMQRAQEQFLVYPGVGASVMEISHRSKAFAAVHEQAKQNIAKLLGLPEHYHVLFLPGGATMQFSMCAMNFMAGGTADYINTGSWASKALQEARKFGAANEIWSGKNENYTRVPQQDELQFTPDARYVHFTSNETIGGVEFFNEPDAGDKPLFCDASSNFLSRPIDISKYALLYAGAQKNVGPSGMAVTIIDTNLLDRVPENLPALLDYKLMVENDSLYNTPPTFTIYMVAESTQWLIDTFGDLAAVAEHNEQKAGIIYDTIDNSGGFYRGHAHRDCRSLMNIPFRLPDEALEAKFISEATAAGLHGLKGHRSVGGCRASIYNAMPIEGARALADFMRDFQQANG